MDKGILTNSISESSMESPHNQPSYQELLAENERLKEVEKKYNALKELFKEGL